MNSSEHIQSCLLPSFGVSYVLVIAYTFMIYLVYMYMYRLHVHAFIIIFSAVNFIIHRIRRIKEQGSLVSISSVFGYTT